MNIFRTKRNPSRIMLIGILLLGGILLLYSGSVALDYWRLPPKVNLPIPGTYTSAFQVSCAGQACHYYRGYQSTLPAQKSKELLEQQAWSCRLVQNNSCLLYTSRCV